MRWCGSPEQSRVNHIAVSAVDAVRRGWQDKPNGNVRDYTKYDLERALATDYVVRARVEPGRLLMGSSRKRRFSLLFHLAFTDAGHQGPWMR